MKTFNLAPDGHNQEPDPTVAGQTQHAPAIQGETTVTFLVAALVFAAITLFSWLGGLNLIQAWLGR